MCAIFGIIQKETEGLRPLRAVGPEGALTREWLRSATEPMAHRGPDGEGYFIDRGIGLAHRRLSIIDLQGGRQPMFNGDESVCVVFNGEIYNFKALRADLEKQGFRFRTSSDTETIVHAYEAYGLDFVTHLKGMFAFGLWDRRKKRLILARDRVGKKPLYYHFSERGLVFSSEMKSLFKSGWVRPSLNRAMLDFYLTLGFVPGPETLFEGVLKLSPGHTLIYEDGRAKVESFWHLEGVQPLDISFQEASRRLEEMLLESVRARLVSDVPLGVFLSGGVDSSSVVASMHELGVKPIQTFSVGYEDEAESELDAARTVAHHFKTEHHEYRLRPMDFFDSLDLLLEHTEEPIIEASGVPLFQIAKMAKQHVTVLLSGEGGDELFAGYGIYAKMLMLNRIRSLVPAKALQWMRSAATAARVPEKLEKYLDWLALSGAARYQTVSNDLTETAKSRLYSDAFRVTQDHRMETYFSDLVQRGQRPTFLSEMQYVDIKTWLADDLLLKGDKMTMAASVETRCPFLDQELVEFAIALPDAFKLKGNKGKFILKEVMRRRLPPGWTERSKKGFPLPLKAWFRGPLYEKAAAILLEERTLARGYFRPSAIEALLEKHRSGREDMHRRIFLLLVLELWHRKYIDNTDNNQKPETSNQLPDRFQ
ncbi:MAG: asparagine synthase (glutamine-hydrolyzing) [Candidatus Omnitrophica bacterium]|nr:asparagine synthase (glutamine-hydrolyzing) [Candidatus Omnitrophota bacterium]